MLLANVMQHIRDGILVVNTETIAGKVITQNLGVVGGSTVRAKHIGKDIGALFKNCLLYTSPSPRDKRQARMPSSA